MKHVGTVGIIALLFFLVACQTQITSFEECAAAGNMIIESYPRQCLIEGKKFVEEVEVQPPSEPVDPPAMPSVFHTCTEQEKQADVCTAEYDPVCGIIDNGIRCITEPCQSTDAVTFSNGCVACSGQALGYNPGACEDQTFVVCKETTTGFDPKEFAEQVGGICVDICPGNFDPYTTQTGIELCTPHYGKEEIMQWEPCDKSTEECNCVKTYETTQGEQIEDALYRCVPEKYSGRLIFRAGLDRLDENGQASVAIA